MTLTNAKDKTRPPAPYLSVADRLLDDPSAGLILSLSVLCLLFIPVFYSDYAYLDEAHQLWHHKDGTNYSMFLVQGRWLTGLLFKNLFAQIDTVHGIKIVRILSFFSWAFFIAEFFRLGKKWQLWIGFDRRLLSMAGIYIACSISLAIYIGWGSCFVVGGASILGLWSGHLLFARLMGEESWLNIYLCLLTGIGSLFMYQAAFGAFLLPFAWYLIEKRSSVSYRILKLGAGVYLVVSVLYYLLFIYSIHQGAASASARTTLSTDLPGKLAFFFSAPLSQAFNLNFLYNMHSVLSQAFPILMMVGWVILYFVKNNKGSFLFAFILLCMLVYLPVLVSKEDFAPYRTMFVLNLVVTILLMNDLLSLIGRRRSGGTIAAALLCLFIAVGFRNFRYNFLHPLLAEYRLAGDYFRNSYDPHIHTVYFLRPPENMFAAAYGIHSFKDEFGVPSTFKDWTPEPLLKQFVLERTKDSLTAGKLQVIQFTDRAAFATEEGRHLPDALFFDMDSIFRAGNR